MLIQLGKITSTDPRNNSGVLVDARTGEEHFFSSFECKNGCLPRVGTIVTFIRDTDYKHTPVAILVHPADEVVGQQSA